MFLQQHTRTRIGLLAKLNAALRALVYAFAAFFAVHYVGNLWLFIELLIDTITTHLETVATS